jgi:hypothetical protein
VCFLCFLGPCQVVGLLHELLLWQAALSESCYEAA